MSASLPRTRLDLLLVQRGLVESRARAQALIKEGKVLIQGEPADKPAALVPQNAAVEIAEPLKYVSRGGLKLEAALEDFNLDPAGKVCLDVGASTGGFTDCLLQRGAKKVYAVDVGKDQLAEKIRKDPRVVSIQKINARELPPRLIPELIELAVMDLSFISLKLVLPAVAGLLASPAEILALVKPQFELGPEKVGKKGVVKNPEDATLAVEQVSRFARDRLGLVEMGRFLCPLAGKKGNRETFLWLMKES